MACDEVGERARRGRLAGRSEGILGFEVLFVCWAGLLVECRVVEGCWFAAVGLLVLMERVFVRLVVMDAGRDCGCGAKELGSWVQLGKLSGAE